MWIDKFLEYLRLERRYSNLTVEAYKNDLLQFSDYLQINSLLAVQPKDIRSFLSHLVSKGLEPTTINRKISSIKSFYVFLLELGAVSKLPTVGVKNLKVSKKVLIPFSEKEMEELFNCIDEKKSDFENLRDKLLLELLYFTGMRKAELINLPWKHINLGNLEIKVYGKGGKERIIPIHPKLATSIDQYKQFVGNQNPILSEYVFVTHKGKKLYPKLVYNIVKSYLSMISGKTKKSPHMIRHSFATHMLNNGAEINAIKEILGHSSLASTQIYTHSDISELKKVFSTNHPRNQNL